jgi:S-adenosylmethionine:tRNA ribosyltransferase-isomerase
VKLSDFDYELPEELIAQYPLDERDGSRMMVLERRTRKIYEKKFTDIADYLNTGDTVVMNDAKVIPARLLAKKNTGAKVELFLLENLGNGSYKVLARPSKRLKIGAKVNLDNGISATVMENSDFGKIVKFSAPDDKLKSIGQIPLPPYIKRPPEKLDEDRYQTVYAKSDGATASPTAGLHFTDEIIGRIKDKGVNVAHVTLNVSYGTFAPVLEEDIEKHKMHTEYFRLPEETANLVNETKKRGNKVLAVGTTTARVLETRNPLTQPSPRWGEGKGEGQEGYTDLFIYPGYKFKVVDMLLTNFHIPKSTLLMLVSAFACPTPCDTEGRRAGREFIFEAYRKAVESRFRFFSYGDCMLIV